VGGFPLIGILFIYIVICVNLLFSWNAANVRHIAKHGVNAFEAEYVIRTAERGFPRKIGHGKWLVKGRTENGRRLQVISFIQRKTRLMWIL